MSAQKLTSHRHIFFAVEPENHDRQIAADSMRPEPRLAELIERQNMWPGAQRWISIKNATRKPLKQVCLFRIDMQVRHFNLRARPGEASLALENSGVVVLLIELHGLFLRFRHAGGKNDLSTFVRLQTYATAHAENWIKHGPHSVRQRLVRNH